MKRILYLDKEHTPMTGGQKYNQDFLDVLQEDCDCLVDFTPNIHESYKNTCKLFVPFIELKWLKSIRESDYVFWGDTSFRYHFLLLILTRLSSNTECIAIVHHYSYLGLKGIRRLFRFCCEIIYNSFMTHIIYPNPYIYDVGIKFFSRKKVSYVPSHINKVVYRDVHPENNRLLFVGSIEPRKGLHLLLKAINIIANEYHFDVKLDMVGKVNNQSYLKMLNEIIEENNLKESVHFLGRVTEKELNNSFRRANVFVFPSLLEGYGLAIVEAMQYGLPVIAFNNSAMPYTIKDGKNGFLVDNEDYRMFAQKTFEVLTNQNLREEMHENAYVTLNDVNGYDDFKISLIDFIKKMNNRL